MDKIDRLFERQVYTTNGILHSLVMLVKILEKNGSLEKGRYQKALRDTFNDPDAEFERADYEFFGLLLRTLEEPPLEQK